jgi:hypothetical protein
MNRSFGTSSLPGAAAQQPVRRHRDDGLLAIVLAADRPDDVDVVPDRQVVVPLVLGLHGLAGDQRVVERGEALLPVEQQVRGDRSVGNCRALQRARLELRLTAGLQRHDDPERKISGDRREQRTDPLVIPLPRPLEVRELNVARGHVLEQRFEEGVVHRHRAFPLSPDGRRPSEHLHAPRGHLDSADSSG